MNAMNTPTDQWVTVEQLPYAEGQRMITQTNADGAYRVFVVDIQGRDARTGEIRTF